MHENKKHLLIVMIMAVAMMVASAVLVCAATGTTSSTNKTTSSDNKSTGTTTVSVKNATGKVNAEDGLNVRKSASAKAEIVIALADNEQLTIKSVTFASKTSTKASKKWYKVSVDGITGYVRADYVDGIKYTSVEAKTTGSVKYKVGAGTKMEAVGTLKKGKTVKVYLKATPAAGTEGSSKTWYMIKVDDKKYYACSKYFKLVETKADEAAKKKAEEEAKKKAEEEAKKKAEEEAAAKIEIKVSGLTYPDSDTPVTEGRTFTLRGTIETNVKMTNIDIGIKDNDGNWVIRVPKQLDSKKFDISTVDNDIKFGILDAGTYKYVAKVKVNGVSKTAFSHKFTVVNTVEKTLTDKIIKKRINELADALGGKYFTTDQEPADGSMDEDCNVEKVVKKNPIVLNLLKTNKGGSDLNASLMPSHYNPGGIAQQRGYSCCGFANFAGWYVAADSISDDVSYKPIKFDVPYTYENMNKYAKAGDLLRSSSHSYMVISVESDGCMVLDCNWDYHSSVQKHKIEWGKYSSVTINRAINRAE